MHSTGDPCRRARAKRRPNHVGLLGLGGSKYTSLTGLSLIAACGRVRFKLSEQSACIALLGHRYETHFRSSPQGHDQGRFLGLGGSKYTRFTRLMRKVGVRQPASLAVSS